MLYTKARPGVHAGERSIARGIPCHPPPRQYKNSNLYKHTIMKKTLIALMALAGVAMADTMNWTGSNYDLSDLTTISASTIGNTDGWIISKTGSDTSPAPVIVTITFTITQNPGSYDQHFLSFGSDGDTSSNAYGFKVKTSGQLEFGQMGTNDLIGTGDGVGTGYTCVIADSLTLDDHYELTLVSKASGDTPGRGSDNFDITLTNLDTNEVITKTAQGFGLNGSAFGNLFIGSACSSDTDVMKGNISSISICSPVPEPATATLSLLALAGLAARRRRH